MGKLIFAVVFSLLIAIFAIQNHSVVNESASLCFKKPAVMNYNVRVDTALAGTKKVLSGVIKIGTPLSQ